MTIEMVNQNSKQDISDFSKLLVRLKIYRNGRKKTQEEVSKSLGISLRTYQRIEQGTAPLEMRLLFKLSETLNVDYEKLAYPNIGQDDIPNVEFFDRFDDYNEMDYPIDKRNISNIFRSLRADIKSNKLGVKDLYKNKDFNESILPCYYTDPNYTWINPTLAQAYGHGPVKKITVFKNLSDFEFVIRLWEVCYSMDNPWFVSRTLHPHGDSTNEVTTINRFTLNEGMPLVIGTVAGSKVVSP